ncbi:MAG: hypothetical protein WBG65_01325 [Sulfurimonadaceae bacterium]
MLGKIRKIYKEATVKRETPLAYKIRVLTNSGSKEWEHPHLFSDLSQANEFAGRINVKGIINTEHWNDYRLILEAANPRYSSVTTYVEEDDIEVTPVKAHVTRGEYSHMSSEFCPDCGANIGEYVYQTIGCPICG